MDRRIRIALLGMLVAGCGGEPGEDRSPLALGGRYTEWFYAGDTARLWARFAPELRTAFGTPDSLATYRDRTLERLGTEQGTPDVAVEPAGDTSIYTRTAAFSRAQGRMVLEWSLAPDGTITGLYLAPATVPSATTVPAPQPAGPPDTATAQ